MPVKLNIADLDPKIKERFSVLIIAYHNLAVEQEFLKSVRLPPILIII